MKNDMEAGFIYKRHPGLHLHHTAPHQGERAGEQLKKRRAAATMYCILGVDQTTPE